VSEFILLGKCLIALKMKTVNFKSVPSNMKLNCGICIRLRMYVDTRVYTKNRLLKKPVFEFLQKI
jgi:hypothetical protein